MFRSTLNFGGAMQGLSAAVGADGAEGGGTAGAVLLVVTILFLAWWWIWPRFLGEAIHLDWRWLRLIRDNVGTIILALVAVSAVLLWLAIVKFGQGTEATDADAQLGALAVAAAVAFTYGTVVPPAVSIRAYAVDPDTCDWRDSPRLRTLPLRRGNLNPVMIGFWNVGIGSWSPFRINVSFPGEGWIVRLHDPGVPASSVWDWKNDEKEIRITHRPASIQVDKSQPLVPGEPQVLRFLLQPPSSGTDFVLTVTVGCHGRFGESRARFRAVVVDSA